MPPPDRPLLAGELVVMAAAASDPDGIAEVEFWVNGKLVGTQVNPSPQGDETFVSTQAWRPTAAGAFALFVRARDTRGHTGRSQPLVFEAVKREDKEQAGIKQHFAAEGETVEEIAANFGTTPPAVHTLNPDLEGRDPAPGESVLIPPTTEEEGSEEEPEVPEVDPAPGALPPPGGEGTTPAPGGAPAPVEEGGGGSTCCAC